MLPIWKCDALGGIPRLCWGMNMPGGSIAGDTWVLWLAERMSVFAERLVREGLGRGMEWEREHPNAGRVREGPADKLPSGGATARSGPEVHKLPDV